MASKARPTIRLLMLSRRNTLGTWTTTDVSCGVRLGILKIYQRPQRTARENPVEQALYVVNNYEYANIVTDLPLKVSDGISMELLGEAQGFAARSTHAALPDARCAIFIGTVSSIYAPATVSGAMSCDGAAGGGGGNGNANGNGNGS